MKLVLSILLLVSVLLSFNFLQYTTANDINAASPTAASNLEGFCRSKCKARCAHARHKRCLKYCRICCRECKCVPSGTYGNKSQCPCYRDKLNSKGKPKCP